MKGKFFYDVLLLFLSFWRKNNIAENSRGKTQIFEFIKQKISVFTLGYKQVAKKHAFSKRFFVLRS